MKPLQEYIYESLIPVNEGILGSVFNFFKTKTKLLQKKFNMSENSSKESAEKMAECQKELDKNLKKLTKNKVKNSDDWWKKLVKAKPELSKVTSPADFSNSLMVNMKNASGVFEKILKEYEDVKILTTEGILYHMLCYIKQFIGTAEIILKDNSGEKGITNQLTKIENLFKKITVSDSEAKKIYDDIMKELSGKGKDFFQNIIKK